jgi:hypothetical protein
VVVVVAVVGCCCYGHCFYCYHLEELGLSLHLSFHHLLHLLHSKRHAIVVVIVIVVIVVVVSFTSRRHLWVA